MPTSTALVYVSVGAAEDLPGPVESGWDGLTSGGVYYKGGNRVRRADPEECMSSVGVTSAS